MINKILNRKRRNYKKYIGAKMYIADMETNGVYFSDEQRMILKEQKEKLLCNYSGLPSVSAYAYDENFYGNHS